MFFISFSKAYEVKNSQPRAVVLVPYCGLLFGFSYPCLEFSYPRLPQFLPLDFRVFVPTQMPILGLLI